MDILKSNMSKADNEIAELDRLLEHTRQASCDFYVTDRQAVISMWLASFTQVLQENQPYLENCTPLLSLLHELEGGEEHVLTASLP